MASAEGEGVGTAGASAANDWVIVRRYPTPNMLAAAASCCRGSQDIAHDAWNKMVRASPQPIDAATLGQDHGEVERLEAELARSRRHADDLRGMLRGYRVTENLEDRRLAAAEARASDLDELLHLAGCGTLADLHACVSRAVMADLSAADERMAVRQATVAEARAAHEAGRMDAWLAEQVDDPLPEGMGGPVAETPATADPAAAERAEVRRAALEEAARIADRHQRAMAPLDDSTCQGAEAQARIIAREIRALTKKEPS